MQLKMITHFTVTVTAYVTVTVRLTHGGYNVHDEFRLVVLGVGLFAFSLIDMHSRSLNE
jgi:hypothetical protein